ncbi:hypothetical protein [Streptacidiphilus rugosus]|uniref:hypothetical protein n=1 Tax=Streptacidiphilus rugosus TaxID=405783 RepID=UPI00055E2A13|nr:hypothetical protein [Streptacidiphilus rugosus]
MPPTLVRDVQPFLEETDTDPRHHMWILTITEPVPAGWWISVGSEHQAEVAQVDACDRADPYYVCRLATRITQPHAAGEVVTVIGELPD